MDKLSTIVITLRIKYYAIICFSHTATYNNSCFQVPKGFSNLMVKWEVGKVYTKSDTAPATVYK